MAEFTRTLFRQGPNTDRTNVILRSGEPAYITDYKRVVVGDGQTSGGNSIGVKFLGFCEFDSFSSEVNNVLPGIPGDIMFSNTTNLLYVLSGTKTILGKQAYQIQSNYKPINKTPTPDEITITSNGGTQLSLINESIDGRYLAGYSLGRGLGKNISNSGIIEMSLPGEGLGFIEGVLGIEDGGVTLTKIEPLRANRVLATLNEGGSPQAINLQEFANALRSYLQGDETNGSLGVPVGTIIDYAGAIPPANYLPCDGRVMSKEIYPELFSAINFAWGKTSETEFNLPNLNERTTVGKGQLNSSTGNSEDISNELGSYGGLKKYQLQAKQLPNHKHGITFTLQAHTDNVEYILPDYVVDVPGGVYTTGNIVKSGFNNYVTIILSQAQAPVTFPRGIVDTLSITRAGAANGILAKKDLLQLKTVEYIKANFPTALSATSLTASNALSAKCFRDTGYIVESIAADLSNNANHRSVETGSLYFSGYITQNKNPNSTVPALPLDQVTPTISAIKVIGNFITGYTRPLTAASTGIVVLSSSSFYPVHGQVLDLIDTMVYPLENRGRVLPYIPAGNPTIDDLTAADIIVANKETIRAKIAAYVKRNGIISGDAVLESKCNRDVGYMIDSVVHTLRTGVNARTIQYGLAYWDGSVNRINKPGVKGITATQVNPTILTIKELSNEVIKVLLEKGGAKNNLLTITTKTSSGGDIKLYETTDDSSLDILKNDFISNLQPSAVVNKCIKVK